MKFLVRFLLVLFPIIPFDLKFPPTLWHGRMNDGCRVAAPRPYNEVLHTKALQTYTILTVSDSYMLPPCIVDIALPKEDNLKPNHLRFCCPNNSI